MLMEVLFSIWGENNKVLYLQITIIKNYFQQMLEI